MPNFSIRYLAVNEYENPVNQASIAFMLLPVELPGQKVWNASLINSLGLPFHYSENTFGFRQALLHISNTFSKLEISLEASVNRVEVNPFDFTPISLEEGMKIINEYGFIIEHHLFLNQTPYTNIENSIIPDDLKPQGFSSYFDFLLYLNKYIFENFEFEPDETNVHTRAHETIELKKGVCQDFAHFFIGVCRLYRIPARYVSGYINQGMLFSGDAQMHAWVEIFLPEKGWVGFDPTNNIMVDHNFIKVCHGSDYHDCSPIKGVLSTHGQNDTRYTVAVQQQ
ncbi:MAG: transglutaminase family protein [Cyclobacteriaceae bacterium]|nr:transglutaminase family protein [Cyclobacteriaceae bacterium]